MKICWDFCFGGFNFFFLFKKKKCFGYEKLFWFYVSQIMLWICQMALDSKDIYFSGFIKQFLVMR